MPSSSLPLPSDYFASPQYSHEEKESLKDLAVQYVKIVYRSIQESGSLKWKLSTSSESRGQQEEYVGQGPKSGDVFHRSVGSIPALVQEIMPLMCSSTSTDFQRSGRVCFEHFVDGQVIEIVSASKDNPHCVLSIKWMVLGSGNKKVPLRDYCFMEHTNMYTEEDGTQVGFRIMESIELKECPSLKASHDIIRGRVHRAGFILRRKPTDSETKILQMNCLDPRGPPAMPASVLEKTRLTFNFVAIRLQQSFRAAAHQKRLRQHRTTAGSGSGTSSSTAAATTGASSKSPAPDFKISADAILAPEHWVESSKRMACKICTRSFGTFRRKHHCRGCGEVLCSSCTKFCELEGKVVRKLRFCEICVHYHEQSQSNAKANIRPPSKRHFLRRESAIALPQRGMMNRGPSLSLTEVTNIDQYIRAPGDNHHRVMESTNPKIESVLKQHQERRPRSKTSISLLNPVMTRKLSRVIPQEEEEEEEEEEEGFHLNLEPHELLNLQNFGAHVDVRAIVRSPDPHAPKLSLLSPSTQRQVSMSSNSLGDFLDTLNDDEDVPGYIYDPRLSSTSSCSSLGSQYQEILGILPTTTTLGDDAANEDMAEEEEIGLAEEKKSDSLNSFLASCEESTITLPPLVKVTIEPEVSDLEKYLVDLDSGTTDDCTGSNDTLLNEVDQLLLDLGEPQQEKDNNELEQFMMDAQMKAGEHELEQLFTDLM